MTEPTKAQLAEELAEARSELADRRQGVIVGLHGVLADMPDIERRRVQTFQAFNVDDVYATVRPLLIKHGLVVTPTVRSVEYTEGVFAKGTAYTDARIIVDYTITALSDGSTLRMTGAAEGRDTQDKATNKALQQAYKYVLIQTLLINTGEDAEEDPGRGDRPVASADTDAVRAENQKRLTNAAKAALVEMLPNATEAAEAWPLVMEKAALPDGIRTESDRDKVIATAESMFLAPASPSQKPEADDGLDAPFN